MEKSKLAYIKQATTLFMHTIGRFFYLKRKRRLLKNHDFSLIASNCNGACILHDLGLKFNSPFVNLWLEPNDFIKMLKSLHHYMSCDIEFIKEEGIDYPIGLLDDVKIYFQHYKNEDEAKLKWKERVARLNYDNLFIMFTNKDGCTLDNLKEFDNLAFAHKVVFVHKPIPSIKSAFYIKGFENHDAVGTLLDYRNPYSVKKYFDDFDYVNWFNSGLERNH